VIYYVLVVLHSEGGGKRKKEREKKRWRENEGRKERVAGVSCFFPCSMP